jgi:branched-chain amino acid transport system substrate-binding protein
MKRAMWIMFLFVFVSFYLASREASAQEVAIPVSGPLSGSSAYYGKNCERGILLAAEGINSEGGIQVGNKRHTVKIISYDDEYKPSETAANIKRFSTQYETPVVFVDHTGGAMALLKFNEQKGFLVVFHSTSPLVHKQGNKLVVGIPPRAQWYVRAYVKRLLDKGIKKAVIMPDMTEYAKEWTEVFKNEWARKGGEILSTISIDFSKDTDFFPQLSKALSLNPDMIVSPGTAEPTGLLFKQARELGYKKWVVGNETAQVNLMARVAKLEILQPVLGGAPYYLRTAKPTQDFVKLFRSKYGQDAPIGSECGGMYEGLYIIARAMEKAGTISDAYKIREAIPKVLPVKQAAGMRTGILDNGALTGPVYGAEVVSDGKIVVFVEEVSDFSF